MHFLCLHGAGTNRDILELQTGGLCSKLEESGHQFTYVNGSQTAKVEDELEGLVDGPFYNHYSRGDSPGSTVLEAFDHTRRIINAQKATGRPFDGVLGFSQGAALAASMIIHHSRTRPAEPPLFRAAVFICGATPWDPTGLQHLERKDAYPIGIPTANIVGKLDSLYPESMKLADLCEPSKMSFHDHGMKHMVAFDVKNTVEMARVINEAAAKA
ncbi:hypothetical protein MYU51_006571 [Penicillium brevicompactum]|uniref:uncharacterized protein n=1 Tax=Penicillium brevicompactum TaxID=5074 RepID=UPI002540CCCA|nr:uncharacterized protein N7506_012281 [Penicillium brevicompactum]KAJ5319577.1 hypothetical protein N7506_012281 [Penicillium brevicompactum]